MTDGGTNGWFARQRERIEALWAQPQVRFGTLVGGLGLAAGLVISAGTTSVIRQTNTTEFCVSCHVYENFYEEFQQSEHFRNATGVQASCASCHLPHDNWASMIAAKAHSGFKDVWAYTLGGIDTPEDFEARRAVLARDIWEQYERNDSQFCRHCHEPEAWDPQAQSAMARGAHQSVVDGDATCIACHKGIAHSIPEGARGDDGGEPDDGGSETDQDDTDGGDEGAREAQETASGASADDENEASGGADQDGPAGESDGRETADGRRTAAADDDAAADGSGADDGANADQGTPGDGGGEARHDGNTEARTASAASAGDEDGASGGADQDGTAGRSDGGKTADGARTVTTDDGADANGGTPADSGNGQGGSTDTQTASAPERDGDDRSGGGRSEAGSDGDEQASDDASAKDGAVLASNCRMCHGAAAPALERFASLSEQAFLSALGNHMATGGTVESLTTGERRALHRYLQR